MPLVEQYPNWVSLDPVSFTELLKTAFYNNKDCWQERPEQSFFAQCAWYKFLYCSFVPWYQNLNTEAIIGPGESDLYNAALPIVESVQQQLGSEYVMWGAELNLVPPGATVTAHCDKHFYSDYTLRTHVVLETNDDVKFGFDSTIHNFKLGECFIFNNKRKHSIVNFGQTNRLHFVIDFVQKPIFQYVERSIAPFGGHGGTQHILTKLDQSMPEYNNFIKLVGKEPYPFLTLEHMDA